MKAKRAAPALTEADIPPLPPPLPDAPERGSFGSQAAFDEAMAEHQAAAARNEEQRKERRRLKEYDALVFEWHQLARLQPPTKYGADHRGRGARSLYALRQPLCPGEPPPAPPLSAAALKRKRAREVEAQLEARRREREREAMMARRSDDPVRVRWEERQARQAAAPPPPAVDKESVSESERESDDGME